jgi:hypothetical protein
MVTRAGWLFAVEPRKETCAQQSSQAANQKTKGKEKTSSHISPWIVLVAFAVDVDAVLGLKVSSVQAPFANHLLARFSVSI